MRSLIFLTAALVALAGCHAKTGAPGEAPTGVTATSGDGLAVVNWDVVPDLTYWIFFAAGDSVSVGAPGSFAIRRALAPRVVNGLTNGTQYAFVMNATHNDSSAGPVSLPVVATPRLAGTNWTAGTLVATQNLRNIGFNGSRLVVVGDAAALFAQDFNYVQGATTWVPGVFPPNTVYTSDLVGVTFSTAYVALARDGTLASSADGVNWGLNNPIATSNPSGVANPIPAGGMNSIVFGFIIGNAPTYVAVGGGGTVYVSHDVLSWTPAASVTTANDLLSVALLNGFYVASGAGGTLIFSQDGSTWTPPVNTGTAAPLRSVAFGPGSPNPPGSLYVAVGDAGTIVTCPGDISAFNFAENCTVIDPATFNPPFTGPLPNLRSVTVGGSAGSRYLAVGEGGAVVYSDDGVNWFTASSGSTLSKVIYNGGLYLGVGDAGANQISR